MNSTIPNGYRRTYTWNPARFLLYPIGSILALLGALMIHSEVLQPSRLFRFELVFSITMLSAGMVFLYLASSRYTQLSRILTFSLGFVAFWMAVVSVQNEPPLSGRDVVLCIASISLPTYVWVIAIKCRPAQEQSNCMEIQTLQQAERADPK